MSRVRLSYQCNTQSITLDAERSEPPIEASASHDSHQSSDVLVDLLARCALEDQKALKQLYERTNAYLFGVAMRMLRQREAAEEVLQEAYIQIWRNASSYRPHLAKPMTWMTSILRYRTLDRIESERKKANTFENLDDDQSLDDFSSEEAGPESQHMHTQMAQQLKDCLHSLTDEIRLCVELAYIYGLSREEIAQRCKTKVNTIKSWLHRGAKRLKLCLQTQA